ncbi:protein OSB1, mitochondrial [Physcomitrium patens]|uniref:Single-stranded DNA-binding protein n=1 Tax=Physcomitrium patens TaxID=3218 RepID=A9T9Z2_PHYPA|nr:protein OSB2, chloroplastic-like [Physcomitrium patens]PNR31480.1 hypothetical protein PHYPA_025601 [Physcomitrium patens]|eukprot:XP_024359366.1 protein OSB2, chloroplastic-like [Physcomitrella patens]
MSLRGIAMSSLTAAQSRGSAVAGAGSVVSMSFTRALRSGVSLASVRRTGLSSLGSVGCCRLRMPVPVAVKQLRTYSQGSRVAAMGGFQGHEVELDTTNEFPRPSSVRWSKEMANTVQLIGNVGRDMEIKYLDTGKVVAKTSLAVQKYGLKKDEPPSWLEMEFWDSLAEIAGHHLKKGDQVYVVGKLTVDQFTTNGVVKKTVKVVATDVHFVEGSRASATGNAQSGRSFSSPSWTQAPPAPSQSQSRSGADMYAAANAETEKLWNEYFSDPNQWWDNRAKKPSPKTPDFKHKSTNEALWIVSKKTPSWVPGQLEKLEAAKQKFIASGGGMPRQSNSISGVDFKDF